MLRPSTIYGAKKISVGSNCTILSNSYLNAVERYAGITLNPSIIIGSNVYIGRHVYLTAMDSIHIEDNCVLSEHVYITDLMHGMNPNGGLILRQPLESKGPVHIGRGCFIGYRASIMPGVTLGEQSIVGVNTVVTRSFPPFSMIAGIPGRLIKTYDPSTDRWIAQ